LDRVGLQRAGLRHLCLPFKRLDRRNEVWPEIYVLRYFSSFLFSFVSFVGLLIWLVVGRHGNGVGWGQVLPSLSPYPFLIYLLITLPIPNVNEKLNPIPILDGFGYPHPCIEWFFLIKNINFFCIPKSNVVIHYQKTCSL